MARNALDVINNHASDVHVKDMLKLAFGEEQGGKIDQVKRKNFSFFLLHQSFSNCS